MPGASFLIFVFKSGGPDGEAARGSPKTDLIEAGAFRVDTLPFLQAGVQTRQFCTYDRAGDNRDQEYFPLYTDTNGEVRYFRCHGPGLSLSPADEYLVWQSGL